MSLPSPPSEIRGKILMVVKAHCFQSFDGEKIQIGFIRDSSVMLYLLPAYFDTTYVTPTPCGQALVTLLL